MTRAPAPGVGHDAGDDGGAGPAPPPLPDRTSPCDPISSGWHVPRLRAPRPHRRPPQAQRPARRRPADSHAGAGPLLPEGAPAAPGARRDTPRSPSATPRSSPLRRRPPRAQEFRASVGAQWTFLADPGECPEGPRHPGVHRPRPRPDDPSHVRAQAGTGVHSIHNGYWFWGRPSTDDLWHDLRGVRADPPRLGSEQAGAARGLESEGDYSNFHGSEQADSGEPVGLNATAHPREAHHGVPGRVRRQRAGRSPGRRGRGAHAGRGRGRGRPGPSGAPRPTVGDIRCRRARPGPSACTGPRTGTSSTRCSALCHSATGCERRSRRSNPTRTTRCAWASSAFGCPSRG